MTPSLHFLLPKIPLNNLAFQDIHTIMPCYLKDKLTGKRIYLKTVFVNQQDLVNLQFFSEAHPHGLWVTCSDYDWVCTRYEILSIDACGCRACIAEREEHNPPELMSELTVRMIVCPECGNKRCPHATDHRHTCTGSNEPGQPGSIY